MIVKKEGIVNLKSLVILLVGIGIGIGIQAALAKGTPDKVVISSGALPHDIVITDNTCMLNALSVGNLEDPTMRVNGTPKVEGDGYLVTRYLRNDDGSYLVFDQARFYRDPQGGYMYVHDLPGNLSEQPDQWFRPTAFTETLLENILLSPSSQNP